MTLIDIELNSITKSYGSNRVVDNVSFAVQKGAFVSILGPSGCGKSTTLNIIAGFLEPTLGSIRVRGQNQAGVPPEKRNIGLVFQNYALFPHMTVAQNVGFGLKMQGRTADEIRLGVERALKSVHLTGFEQRYPKELSGGQQQRAALARAIAPAPSVLLLDEPLSNLDLKLREAMRIELKEIQEELGMTFVYVTHDQEEAMAMSDHIIVMSAGVVAQQGAPGAIYRHPKSRFVADFIGKSNILSVKAIDRQNGLLQLNLANTQTTVFAEDPGDIEPGDARYCCIRPERLELENGKDVNGNGNGLNKLDGVISRLVNLGSQIEVWTTVESEIVMKSHVPAVSASELEIGKELTLAFAPGSVQLLSD